MMLVVRVELHSAITGEITEIARMRIANTGTGTDSRGNYEGVVYSGRSKEALDRCHIGRRGEVKRHPRQMEHVWNLVSKMLASMSYRTS